ncbi:BTB/POZ domain-containing protein KCTD6-like [Branchiostoma lanceolatum]|uniref:KCTD15 protein n=1 Tax=Branchiostoma lanceolatum TaxID=7740 RepID=A0A8J9YUS4_BRALA|nr:KCTD15 [Branchiostoma lanceolatum]
MDYQRLNDSDKPITLNVGGHIYTTAFSTLTRYPDSTLGILFGGGQKSAMLDERGNYFLDRDGEIFRYVLNYLRTGQLNLPSKFPNFDLLCAEAEYYQIPGFGVALAKYRAGLGNICVILDVSPEGSSLGVFGARNLLEETLGTTSGKFRSQYYSDCVVKAVEIFDKLTARGFILQGATATSSETEENGLNQQQTWTFCRSCYT